VSDSTLLNELPLAEAQPDYPEDSKLYVNRELSLLEFQRRVLEEALDENNPLLERVKFLSIVGSNLDEFFMVRVAGLKQQVAAGIYDVSPDGMTPAAQLAAIRHHAAELMSQAQECLLTQLLPALAQNGIVVLRYADLNEKQKVKAKRYFEEIIFPVLTPLAFDPGRPFPHISNLSLNLAILIRGKDGEEEFARLKVPSTLPALVPLKKSSGGLRKDGTLPEKHYFVWLDQLIMSHLASLFPGMEIIEAHPFFVTRNADLAIQELEADDLLETMEESVRQRRFGDVTRLLVNSEMSPRILEILISNLEITSNEVYTVQGPLCLNKLMGLYAIDRHDLKEPPFQPAVPPGFDGKREPAEIFSILRREPLLLHHPYDSFMPVIEFLNMAAKDPDVLAIKMTLYRIGKNSPVVDALLEANENGKQVAVLLELKARFDEESNIQWAKALESEGVHVVYGLLGLKTHSKILLVVRREGRRIRRYVHLATGNYNPVTAQIYTDLGYFTCDDDIGADASDLFNYLTGYSAKSNYNKLLIAPINLREKLTALIEREIEHQARGEQGHLIFKVNSLADNGMIRLLCKASQAGVKVDLIVRGICCLRPGIPGISENIRVISIVGRFLEHSRIFYFRNAGAEEIFLGSADLMTRNISHRVEIVFPVEDPKMLRILRDGILEVYLGDNVKARRMSSEGIYERLRPTDETPALDSQISFIRQKGSTRRPL
jgi:polyphosphate kinase